MPTDLYRLQRIVPAHGFPNGQNLLDSFSFLSFLGRVLIKRAD
jgi:hypothetical protein